MHTVTIVCQRCGAQKEIHFSRRHQKYCSGSCAKAQENHPCWRGGRTVNSDGYIRVSICKGVEDREHILVAEKALGRPLPRHAVVHHVDENKQNNSKNNLVICENRSYHKLLHQRMSLREIGGDLRTQKRCYGCKKPRPKEEFCFSKNRARLRSLEAELNPRSICGR